MNVEQGKSIPSCLKNLFSWLLANGMLHGQESLDQVMILEVVVKDRCPLRYRSCFVLNPPRNVNALIRRSGKSVKLCHTIGTR